MEENLQDATCTLTKKAEWANFPLAPCRLITLHKFYYAIGNNPARNILYRDISSTFDHIELMKPNSWRYYTFDPSFEEALTDVSNRTQDLRVLCLACGDLRNILFSLGSSAGLSSVEFVINDYDAHVIARNILLLDMIFDVTPEENADETIFAIWFSTGLHAHHLAKLHKRLQKLIVIEQPTSGKTDVHWLWHCYEPGLIVSVKSIWTKWLHFFSGGDASLEEQWERTQEMRHTTFLHWSEKIMLSASDTGNRQNRAKDIQSRYRAHIKEHRITASFTACVSNLEESTLPPKVCSSWRHEIHQHLLTGLFLASNSSAASTASSYCVNPTLFYSEHEYNLHYGTDSFLAFPGFVPTTATTAVDSCFEMFTTWLDNARKNQSKLEWTFSSLDCQTFCFNFNPKGGAKTKSPGEPINKEAQLSKGALVVTKGLQKCPHLNGIIGLVTSTKAHASERWGVQLLRVAAGVDYGASLYVPALPCRPVSLKKSNLSLLPSACAQSSADSSSAYFDIISTSNVSDHIGLSTLLIMVRPLLLPGGTLFTTSFLKQSFGSTRDYLMSSLLEAKPEWWPALFRFRAMGYENGTSTTEACRVAHSDFEIGVGSKHADSTIVWIATSSKSNLCLAKHGLIANHLKGIHQNTRQLSLREFLHGKAAATLCRLGSKELLSEDLKGGMELTLLVEALSSQLREVVLCSFEVEDPKLRTTFLSEMDPTPTMYVKLKDVEIHGLWLEHLAEDKRKISRFFFWSKLEIMEQAEWKASLHSTGEHFVTDKMLSVCVEHWDVCQEKLERLASMLVDTTPFPYPSAQRTLPEPPGSPVCFELFDESDAHFVLHVHPNRSIFGNGKLECNIVQVSQIARLLSTLTVIVTIPCAKADKSVVGDAIVSKDLVFSGPVSCKEWKFDKANGLLQVQRGKYGFFSTARTTIISGCVYPGKGGKGLSWTDVTLRVASCLQFGSQERSFKKLKAKSSENYQMPLLTEVKDSMMILLQLVEDTLIYLVMKEAGIGVVAIILRHGILMDCQRGTPILDLSVCFLSKETSMEMANAVNHLSRPDGGIRHIKMWKEQYRLFQNLCNYTRVSMAPELRCEHPSLSSLIRTKSARKKFRRVLLAPFYPSASDSEDAIADEVVLANRFRDMLLYKAQSNQHGYLLPR